MFNEERNYSEAHAHQVVTTEKGSPGPSAK